MILEPNASIREGEGKSNIRIVDKAINAPTRKTGFNPLTIPLLSFNGYYNLMESRYSLNDHNGQVAINP